MSYSIAIAPSCSLDQSKTTTKSFISVREAIEASRKIIGYGTASVIDNDTGEVVFEGGKFDILSYLQS